ncbi:MAG: glycosyltransferase family 9 protein [Verrucomicrobia bacterium]|nr:glycosyltransferase family 9 protein [Verrucomicrobiota bacterium]
MKSAVSIPSDQPRILVIRGGAIGDFILTLPAIGALRERWPQAHIEILGYPRILALADRRHYADTVRSIDAAAMASFFVDGGDLNDALGDYFGSFDLIVSYLYDPDDIFGTNLRRCRVRNLVCGSAKPEKEHAAVHFTRPLAALGINVADPVPRIFPSADDRAFAEGFMRSRRREEADAATDKANRLLTSAATFIAVHPGSGGQHKVWPADRWADVIRWLRDELKRDVMLVLGEADDVARRALEPLKLPMAENLSLPRLAAVLERCALFAGHDSGVTHLAAAVGTPTLALFGPTSPAVWAPRGPRVWVLAADGPIKLLSLELVRDALRDMVMIR